MSIKCEDLKRKKYYGNDYWSVIHIVTFHLQIDR